MNGFGQDFGDFMTEQGLYDEAKELAAKKLAALDLQRETEARKIPKTGVSALPAPGTLVMPGVTG